MKGKLAPLCIWFPAPLLVCAGKRHAGGSGRTSVNPVQYHGRDLNDAQLKYASDVEGRIRGVLKRSCRLLLVTVIFTPRYGAAGLRQ